MSIQSTDYLSILTVTIVYGNTTLRFCDADENFVAGGNTYLSDPLLRATMPERSGVLEEDDADVFLSSSWGFLLEAASGRAFPAMEVKVVEHILPSQIFATEDSELLYHFVGKASSIEINPDGEEGVAKLTVLNPKQKTEKALDNLALERCRNDFGSGKVCEFDRETAERTGTLTAIDRTKVTITGLAQVPSGWYESGFVEHDGLRIKIRYWRSGDEFTLTQIPPVSWEESLPLQVTVSPGCAKDVGSCGVFNQLQNFRGIGVDIPEHHPVFEKPDLV